MDQSQPIRDLLGAVHARWRLRRLLQGVMRSACAASALLALAIVAARWADRSPLVLMAIASASLVLVIVAIAWGLAPVRRRPSDQRMARFIEERAPSLDDRLATAVDVLADPSKGRSPMAASLLTDAAARARNVAPDAVLPRRLLYLAGLQAAGAGCLIAAVAFFSGGPMRQSLDAATLLLFPSSVHLSVEPGHARVVAGTAVAIKARLDGSRAPIDARLQIGSGDGSRTLTMPNDGYTYTVIIDSVTAPFTYRVVAGTLTSPTYAIAVTHPPRVTRIDLEYTYPAALGLKSTVEEDSGDVYGPAGTQVRVRVHTDPPATRGQMVLGTGSTLPLTPEQPSTLSATLKISGDDVYRLSVSDLEGVSSLDHAEYFIRVLDDRPPDVHITRPAGDRSVTRLEEIDIEVQADDDRGIGALELVYAPRGEAEHIVPLEVPRGATSVTTHRTLALEDLDVHPGDFVSYYVRARDNARGRRANEARSDIFFLEVKPYEQEFSLATSQSMAGSGYSGALDELVDRQRQVVVATWKLNARAERAKGARADTDIRTIARTEADLKSRVEQVASTFRESTMRDPRKGQPSAPVRPEEDAMAAAAGAMTRAAAVLEALDTNRALPPEMQALNHLLRAQAEIKRRQITANQSAAGAAGNNNRNFDISALFDRELQRQQQTSYETAQRTQQPSAANDETLDRIKEMAKRQDELLRRQQALAEARLPEEARKRELEQLTREQSDLRRRAEDLARQMAASRPAQSGASSQNGGSRMRDASQAMQQAAGDLRRGAPERAGVEANKALTALRRLERDLQSPNRLRASGELQLEAREIADDQRQIAAGTAKLTQDESGRDGRRRLAGDQERLADRVRRLQAGAAREPLAPAGTSRGNSRGRIPPDIARGLEGLADRMQKSADGLRSGDQNGRQAAAQEDIARQLDRVADRLTATGSRGDDSRRMSEQLAKTQQLREKLDQLGRALEKAGRQNGRGDSSQKTSGESGRLGEGRQGAGGTDLSQLREEYLRRLKEAEKLLDETRRDDSNVSRNGAGFTLEGQGMILSAPGTEAFKQDFAKWDLLKRQATAALEETESALARKLQASASKDRLAAGIEDKAPAAYQAEVDTYFKALAARKP